MRFRMFGSLQVVANGKSVDLGPPKQRTLLAVLLLHPDDIIPTDQLIDSLWPDRPPRTAAHSIQIYVSELRKTLEPLAEAAVIVTRRPGYQLLADPDSIDVGRFERLVAHGTRDLRSGDRLGGVAHLRSALDLWTGPPLSDFTYEEFAQPHINRLNGLHVDAREELAAADLLSGRIHEALPLIEAAIQEDPSRERSRELLMTALYRAGRHVEALRTYQRYRDFLAEELGLDPSPRLRRLQERILLHDPTLTAGTEQTASTAHAPRNPYKGLRPFGEQDAADFFGREALVETLLTELAGGSRLIALVGPSGSGKSSVIAAGLVPRVREGALPGSDRWVIAQMLPGTRPLQEMEAVVARAAALPVGLKQLMDGARGDRSALRMMPEDSRLLLVIDQFEELFSVTDVTLRQRFLHALSAAVTEPNGQVTIVLTLRADFYDRPLLEPGFADVFTPGVVNVVPMTAQELESAVVAPAERVGIRVEPALLAELIADTAGRFGALPLLQHALAELFDHRRDVALTMADYRAIGGVRGALSRRAESLYEGLDREHQRAAMQVFLQFVRLGAGARDARRRAPLSELTALGLDAVMLSELLERFGRHRLLSFDRDPLTGDATVELAHEALCWEWARLAAWIDQHRAALRRRDALLAAVTEWQTSGKDPDYLLSGNRLDEFTALNGGNALHLTRDARDFLEASLERRRSEQAGEVARAQEHRRLERRATIRLVALAVATLLLAGTGTYAIVAANRSVPPDAALLFHGVGEVNEIVEAGFDRGVTEFGMVAKERIVDTSDAPAALRDLSEAGTGLILAFTLETDVDSVAHQHPKIRYVVPWTIGREPNVSYLQFADHEGSYLAGAAAALKSRTGTIGFVGGVDVDVIWRFQAGYEAGARAVDRDINILTTYLTKPPDYEGYNSPAMGERAAQKLYAGGADVVFHAAGMSGVGVFQAATDMSKLQRRHLWAIGVDSDQYETVATLPGSVGAEAWKKHILTSMVKRLDVAVYTVLAEYSRGVFRPGAREFDLASRGVDIAYSGGHIDDIRATLEDLRAKIIAHEITVPQTPASTSRSPG